MTMSSQYLKYSLWDFVLTALAAIALSYQVLNGFYIDPALQHGIIPGLVAVVCLVALFFIEAGGKRRLLPGSVCFGIGLVAVWVVSAALSPEGAILTDRESNYLIFALVTTLVPLMCFLLSRSRVGTAILFALGAFISGLLQLLYGQFEVVWTVVFLLAALALLVYRTYLTSVRESLGVQTMSFAPGFLAAVGTGVLTLGLGLLAWFFVVAPLHPQAVDVKLVTEYRALETLQVKGTSDAYQTPNTDMTSDRLNEGVRTTDVAVESVDGLPIPATGQREEDPRDEEETPENEGLDVDDQNETYALQANPIGLPVLLGLLLIIALIVAFFGGRRAYRKARLSKWRRLGPEEEFRQAYLFLLTRLERLGIGLAPGQTMLEFAGSSKNALYHFDEQAGLPFSNLAVSYARLTYGNVAPSSDETAQIETYYQRFWKGCRAHLGNVKYFFRSFRL